MTPVESRERLYDILADSDRAVDERIDEALELGVEYLALPIGFFTRISDGTQRIVQSVGDNPSLQPGETCPLDSAYCRRTVETESPLAIQDANISSAVADIAVEQFGLRAYIGARIVVNDDTYGTLCFADTEPRTASFTSAESFFVELAARLVGQALERQSHDRKLQEREAKLRTQEEFYRAIVDASFDLVFQVDDEGRFTFISPSIEQLLGYDPTAHIGEPFTMLLPDEETMSRAETIYQQVMSGETVQQEFFPLEHSTGDVVLVDIKVTPLFDSDVSPDQRTPDDIVGVQGTVRDARSRKRSEHTISVLNRVLRHNLRNDMNVISSYAELLTERLEGENATFARQIIETSDQLVSLSETAQTLEENMNATPALSNIDVVGPVRQIAREIDDRYPDASVTLAAPDSAVAVCAPRLEAAVSELVENAALHGGEAPSVMVSVTVDEEHVRIQVTDDGPGLPDHERAVLVSGDETPLSHSSGLGLWLVHWIVETLGGQLQAEETDQHTCIEILLQRPDTRD